MQKLLVLLPSNRWVFVLCELAMNLGSHQLNVSWKERSEWVKDQFSQLSVNPKPLDIKWKQSIWLFLIKYLKRTSHGTFFQSFVNLFLLWPRVWLESYLVSHGLGVKVFSAWLWVFHILHTFKCGMNSHIFCIICVCIYALESDFCFKCCKKYLIPSRKQHSFEL